MVEVLAEGLLWEEPGLGYVFELLEDAHAEDLEIEALLFGTGL